MGTPVAIVVVVLAVIAAGALYYYRRNAPQATPQVGQQLQKKMLVVRLAPLGNSGQMGTAVLHEKDGKVRVEVDLLNAPASAEPAHIHAGACPNPGEVKYPLTSVAGGLSDTVLDVSLNQLLASLPLAINIHKSANDIKTYVACGDLLVSGLMPERGGTDMLPGGLPMLPPGPMPSAPKKSQ